MTERDHEDGSVSAISCCLRLRIGERQEGRRPVDQRKIRFDPIGPHGHLPAVNAVRDRDGCGAARRDRPAILCRLRHAKRLAGRPGCCHVLDVTLVLPNEVRPGRPRRHHQLDFILSRGRDVGADLDVVRVRRRETQGVADGVHLALGLRLRRLRGATLSVRGRIRISTSIPKSACRPIASGHEEPVLRHRRASKPMWRSCRRF